MANIHKDILRIAVPSILANITIPLVGLVDMVIAGHISQAWAIGGIAVGTMLFDMLYGCFGFLRVSTAGLTAQAYGADHPQECGSLFVRSAGLALTGALLVWLLQMVYLEAVLYVMPCSQQVADFARSYFRIRIWAAPATLMLMTCKGWFIGMQDGTRAMVADVVVNGVNMLASYMLAVHTPLGAIGVAYGTLIAQWLGLIVALTMIVVRYADYFQFSAFKSILSNRDDSTVSDSRFFRLNADLFVRSLCFIIVYVGWTAVSSAYGDVELAASALMMKLFMLFSFFIDGFAYAAEALVGKQIGEQQSGYPVNDSVEVWPHNGLSADGESFSRLMKALFAWGVGMALLFSLVYAVFPDTIYGWLTADRSVVQDLSRYTVWLVAMPLVSMLAFMWDGVFAGATQGRTIRNAMLLAASAFAGTYLVCYLAADALHVTLSLHALFAAYFAHLLARVIYLTWKYFRM